MARQRLIVRADRLAMELPSRAVLREFAIGFICVFAGLALPSPGLGPAYCKLHGWMGNALVGGAQFASGVRLHFESSDDALLLTPWSTTLVVEPPAPSVPVLVPIDLRSLSYLPTVTFIALAVATPMGSRRRNLRVVGAGLVILAPLLLVLLCVPVISFLGGTGPMQVFSLSQSTHVVLQVVYRALVMPPGMAYALPLLLWWVLLRTIGAPRRGPAA